MAKSTTFYGPRQASWTVKLTDSRSCSVYGNAQAAHDTVAYFAADGRTTTVTRTELCTVPGCDGHGTVSKPGKRGLYKTTECPRHETAIDVAESI
jgi:hypothetical protein